MEVKISESEYAMLVTALVHYNPINLHQQKSDLLKKLFQVGHCDVTICSALPNQGGASFNLDLFDDDLPYA